MSDTNHTPHEHRGRTILPCDMLDHTNAGERWYVQTYHSTGTPWGEQECPRFGTLDDAREWIDDQLERSTAEHASDPVNRYDEESRYPPQRE